MNRDAKARGEQPRDQEDRSADLPGVDGPRAGRGTGRRGDGPGANRPHGGRLPTAGGSAEPSLSPGTREEHPPSVPVTHAELKAMLGAWALAVCTPAESAAVDAHLDGCRRCAEEARSLRDAVPLLQRPESLDLDPLLRTRVLDACLDRRPPRIPVPEWAAPYDAETARLDALLQDIDEAEWHAPVRLRWIEEDEERHHRATVAKVIAHLMAVDGLVAVALGLADPLSALPGGPSPSQGPGGAGTPTSRTRAYWAALHRPPTREVRDPWRAQSHDLVRTSSFTEATGGMPVTYGPCEIPLRDAMLERAFACWVHGGDIADAVNYPYRPPAPRHLHALLDLAARRLPDALAARRRAGRAAQPGPGARHLVSAGRPGRSLLLEVEGRGGGEWLIPLDSPAALPSENHVVAQVVLDDEEFAQVVAGHIRPREAAAGQSGDRTAVEDVLYAAASLSRL